jgi:hypothetical protein
VKEVEAQVLDLKDKTKIEVAAVLARRYASPYTDIFSSLLIAQKLFHDEIRRKVLVLMSDMIEDTPGYNFEKIAWSPFAIEKLLAELEAKALIPNRRVRLRVGCVRQVRRARGGHRPLLGGLLPADRRRHAPESVCSRPSSLAPVSVLSPGMKVSSPGCGGVSRCSTNRTRRRYG